MKDKQQWYCVVLFALFRTALIRGTFILTLDQFWRGFVLAKLG